MDCQIVFYMFLFNLKKLKLCQSTIWKFHSPPSVAKSANTRRSSSRSAPDQLHFADLQSAYQTLYGSRTGTPEQVPSGGCRHQDCLSRSHHPRHLRDGVQIPNQVPNPLWFRPLKRICEDSLTGAATFAKHRFAVVASRFRRKDTPNSATIISVYALRIHAQ